MKFISKISIILAASILLMHSLLPHDHHSELDDDQHVEAHETATSFLDFIKLAFHIDLGEDHLESYNIAEQQHLAFDLVVTPATHISFETTGYCIESKKYPFPQENLHYRYLFRHLSLRGPPQSA